MAVLLALASSIAIGTSDMLGTLAGRRGGVLAAVLANFALGGVLLVPVAAAFGGTPSLTDLAVGAVAGVLGGVGLLALYGGYATTTVGIVAPIAAVLGAVVPVSVGLIVEAVPGPLGLGGIALGVAAIGLLAVAPTHETAIEPTRAVMYGVVAGLALGVMVTLLGLTRSEAGLWPLIPARVSSAVILIPIARFRGVGLHATGGAWRLLPFVGILSAGGMALFVLAAQENLIVAGLLLNMAYAVTAVLAILLFKERSTLLQRYGFALAALSITLLAVG